MVISILLSAAMTTGAGPIDSALEATEAPRTLRAAFTVELTSRKARRVFAFDPRLPEGERWRLGAADGEDGDLDEAAAAWCAEPAPDGRLFPDDLRESMGPEVEVEDLGAAWRIGFKHRPSDNDGEFDVWAAERLSANAWLEPETQRFLRIDYTLPRPVRAPEGGRLVAYDQTYYIETEPRYGVSLVTAFSIEAEGRFAFRRIRRAYSARVTEIEVFFANRAAEQEFLSLRQDRAGRLAEAR